MLLVLGLILRTVDGRMVGLSTVVVAGTLGIPSSVEIDFSGQLAGGNKLYAP
jgi:hypothetical protein